LGGSCGATTALRRRYGRTRKNTQNRAKKTSEIENFEEDRRRKYSTFIPTNSHDYRNDGDKQALLNRLEPIFEPVFDDASFGYRRGRSTHDALRKVWNEIQGGREWIVDADLKDFLDVASYCPLINDS
jgi:hypothetical protein